MKFFTTSTTTTIAAAICCTLFFIGIKKSIDSNTPLNSLSSETKLAIAESPKIGQTPQQTVPILEKSSVAQLSKVSKPFKTGRLWDAQSDIEAAIEDDEATEEANEKRTVEARWAAEFEMIKDPKTGQMPRGIHQKELIAAKKVRALQLPAELSEDGLSVRSLPTIGITPRGPNNYGGRTLALGIDVRNTNIVIAGGASAGIFRSTDGGANWTRVTPSGEIHSVTAIAQDTRAGQQDTWYCGSGERNSGSSNGVGATYFGNGLWKSTNNGVTWTALASTQSDLYSFDNDFDFIK